LLPILLWGGISEIKSFPGRSLSDSAPCPLPKDRSKGMWRLQVFSRRATALTFPFQRTTKNAQKIAKASSRSNFSIAKGLRCANQKSTQNAKKPKHKSKTKKNLEKTKKIKKPIFSNLCNQKPKNLEKTKKPKNNLFEPAQT
jgi:hypothetical protein